MRSFDAPRPAARADDGARDHSAGTALPPRPRLAEATVAAWALVPLRAFLGVMFVYAGVDKLLDPAFLQASGPGSIAEQLQSFERVSPLAPLIHVFGDPFPVMVGLLIALLEIAIGLGAILGLLFRWAALAGAALSILFFLTASWETRPFYYGPDLPYAFGWLTLALAGHGHLYALDDYLARRAARAPASEGSRSARRGASARGSLQTPRDGSQAPGASVVADRRQFLQLGILAGTTLAVAAVAGAWPWRSTRPPSLAAGGGPPAGAGPGPVGAPPASAATAAPRPGGQSIGKLADLQSQGSLYFQDPGSGDPGIVVGLGDGTVVAYDAACTHEGCTVEFDGPSSLLFCPCHGAVFDPSKEAEVLQGPARRPLAAFPIQIDRATGAIYLRA
jgi:thiosulfate dehydrogenase [quinone] large subunit